MSLNETTDADFANDVLASPIPVLVEFTATWCPPCRMVAPILEQIAADKKDHLRVVALDVDANPAIPLKYQVMGMPTMALFINGEIVARMLGARSRTAILRELEPHLTVASAPLTEGPGFEIRVLWWI
jgi:thioredoxin 1